MDAVYGSYNANATVKINIGEYFRRFKELIDSGTDDLRTRMTEDEYEELAHRCNINNLVNEEYFIPPINRVGMKKVEPIIPEGANLQTLLRLETKYSKDPKHYRPALKYRNENTVNYEQPIESDPKAIEGVDILVSIRIYHPFGFHSYDTPRKRLSVALSHVINILGRQTLAELRDKIECISDLSNTVESSEHPTEFSKINNRDMYKSSFFYIEGTFYNDNRYEDCKNNSDSIIQWAKSRKLGPFNTAKMEDVTIESLSVKFGYPWVFQHQGNCEHLIAFSDARLIDSSDHLSVANYPRISRIRLAKHPYCLMCSEKPVNWVVVGNDRLPHDPCHFCHQCFIRYNYIDGKKVGAFSAYRYPRDAKIINSMEKE